MSDPEHKVSRLICGRLASHLQYDLNHLCKHTADSFRDYQSFTKQTRELGHFTKILRDHVKELISKGDPSVIVRSPKRESSKKE